MATTRWTGTRRILFVAAIVGILGSLLLFDSAGSQEGDSLRQGSQQRMQQGNFQEAYDGFRKLCLDADTAPLQVPGDFENAVMCLQRLGRIGEFDAFAEATVGAHSKNHRLLRAVAQQYLQMPHFGHLIGDQFERGGRRGGGQVVNSLDRDRVRALQLLAQGLASAEADADRRAGADHLWSLADALLSNRGHQEAWRLQTLTDLSQLPDYGEGYPHFRQINGAPVDADGNPVLHHASDGWEGAETDGQRWRWAQRRAVELAPDREDEGTLRFAEFLRAQFGVQTMLEGIYPRGRRDDGKEDESGPYALETLGEDETIARLATGIKRFKLPDEFNHVRLYQRVAAKQSPQAPTAMLALGEIFENRRQFPKAAEWWQKLVSDPNFGQMAKQRLEQIVANWGRFEPTLTQPAGRGAELLFRYRNGKRVEFRAQAIKTDELLADIKAYLRSNPGQLDWQQFQLDDIGYRLVEQDQAKYVGEEVAKWGLDLDPRPNHLDRVATISTPLQRAGAYLLTASMADGNVSKIVVWVNDTVLVRKQLSEKSLYFVADARTGQPVSGANVEFFGYQLKQAAGRRFEVLTTNFSEKTDAAGQTQPDPRDLVREYQWLVVARGEGGRLAYLGFRGVWSGRYHDEQYNATKVYAITDRPVYRPAQSVKFKIWIARTQYDQGDESAFANQTFPVEIRDGRGEKVLEQTLTADRYGGIEGSYELPTNAALGVYQLIVPKLGGGNFRVEEYKKPEFEVKIEAPDKPVSLGEKIPATVVAKYYFGAPVTEATVLVKVTREERLDDWYPVFPWDWCYGPGYWWFCYDTPWYRGWSNWAGCVRPFPWWWPAPRNPPELVLEQEAPIGPDGTVRIEIDSALAQALHPDQDQQYSITAEVRDQSRRTIVGQGKVIASRKPYKVYLWLTRGYQRVGDTIEVRAVAQTPDRKPVQGEGTLRLFRVAYDAERNPVETEVGQWPLGTDSEGRATRQLTAAAAGQYRLSYTLADDAGHEVEGGYLFTIVGDRFDGADFRFNDLELIPDRAEYQPGQTVQLQINTDHPDSTVLLFVRPANGVYLPPKLIRVQGRSTIEPVMVVQQDMPNFFVEALTVSGGKVHVETKEIVVPPEKRVLNVEILPSQVEYLPGQDATVRVRLTDHTGENYRGSTVVTIYDKSVEYISGGSNVSDIREFFWKWRRQHQPATESSLDGIFSNHVLPSKMPMQDIGIFGGQVIEKLDAMGPSGPGGFGGGGGRPMMRAMRGAAGGEMAAMDAAPMAANAMAADKAGAAAEGLEGVGGGAAVEPTVRTRFADTALWVGSLETDDRGEAQVQLKLPEDLTTWKIRVWGMGSGARVGGGDAEIITRKNLLVRLQAPRFFVERDEVVLSANVHNYLNEAKDVQVSLVLPDDGPLVALGPAETTVRIEASGEQRVDWRVKVRAEGTATIQMRAVTDVESDAVQLQFPCQVHGMLKTESFAGTIRPDRDSARFTVVVPAERRVEQSVLEVRYSPTLAGAMVDALPYLIDYPHGCTEQTLNRFLPAAVTQKVLQEMNLNLALIHEKQTNLNAQEIGDDRARAEQWKRFDVNPVFDEGELGRVVQEGVKALTNMQLRDGGWGWFSGYGEQSYPHTTAVVVHGLQIAQQNDVPIVPDVLTRGLDWLRRYQAEEARKLANADGKIVPWKQRADNLDALVYMVLADAGDKHTGMRDFLYRDRIELSVYAKAMFALALEQQQEAQMLEMLVRNIGQFLVVDAENETAYLRLPEGNAWWYWYGSEVEANAYYLKLLARVDPQSENAPRLVKYLLNNRKHATYWDSTRDTSLCVEAFADYLRATGELSPEMVVEVYVDGEKRQEVAINADNLFTFDNKLVLVGDEVQQGSHVVELRRRGKGPVYFNAYLTNFTLEDQITKAGLEVRVERNVYRLISEEATVDAQGGRGQAATQRVEKYRREPLANLALLKSGELIEVELVIESKNDYEYLVFEDRRAAGCEAVDVRSGYVGGGLRAYRELRDDRAVFYVHSLPRGKHSLTYRLRAEIPGQFSALPARAEAMYAPELRGNSDEIKLRIED